MVFVDCEVVDAAPLVAVASTEDNDLDRRVRADCARTLSPRTFKESLAIAPGEAREGRTIAAVFVRLLFEERCAVDEHMVQGLLKVGCAPVEGA